MKYLKKFEKLNETIELIGYPEGNIIEVTVEEKKYLVEEGFDITWDDEPDYDNGIIGQWRFLNDEEEDIENFLDKFRNSGLVYDEFKNSKKYNL